MCVLFFPMTSNMKMGAQKKNTNGTRKNYDNKITTITIKLESFFAKVFHKMMMTIMIKITNKKNMMATF